MHVIEQPKTPTGRYTFEIPAARRNHLLAALPYEECSRVWSNLELVELPAGSVLHQSGERVNHVYFPTAGASLVRDRSLERGDPRRGERAA